MKQQLAQAQVILQKESKDLSPVDFLVIYDLLTTKRLIHPSLYRVSKQNVKWIHQQMEVDKVILQLKKKLENIMEKEKS